MIGRCAHILLLGFVLSVAACSGSREATREDLAAHERAREAHRRWAAQTKPIRANNADRFEACYHHSAPEAADRRGSVTAKIEVGADGRVRHVTASEFTDGFADVADCVSQVATKLTFPAPPDPRSIIWTFEFGGGPDHRPKVAPRDTSPSHVSGHAGPPRPEPVHTARRRRSHAHQKIHVPPPAPKADAGHDDATPSEPAGTPLTPDQMRRAHEQAKGRLHRCYLRNVPRGLRKDGDIVRLEVTVDESGRATNVDVMDSSAGQAKFLDCVRGAIFQVDYGTRPTRATTYVQKIGFDDDLSAMMVYRPTPPGGNLGRRDIVRIANQHIAEFMKCYESELDEHPDLAGTVKLKITVGRGGRVTEARVVEATLPSIRAQQCMVHVAEGLTFPPPSGTAYAEIPLQFGSH